MRKTLIPLLVILCVTSVAEEKPATATATEAVNIRLVEVFNAEQLPGSGKLIYTAGGETLNIALGGETGYYGLGMVFKGANLPDQYGRDFQKNDIIQVALGSMTSKLQGQIPQFGAATIITRGIKQASVKYPLQAPKEGKPNYGEVGFLLFTSPITPNERSDEDKLKSTYFANGGTVVFTPKGKSVVKDIKWQGQRLKFDLQMMQVKFEANLVTPFSSTPGSLTGSVEFPIYSAKNAAARKMTQRIAGDSMRGSVTVPQAAPRRDVSGSKRK